MPDGDPRAARILDEVRAIPRGFVRAYSDVEPGAPRVVGRVLATTHEEVPWHRVVRADGSPAAGHEAEALRRHRREGTALTASGTRLDMSRARWHPDED